MPTAVRVAMTSGEHAAVAAQCEQTNDVETRLRYQMVLPATNDYSALQIAPLVRRSVSG